MPPASRLLTRTFLIGVLIVSTAYGASALTVQRTNTLVDGTYVPSLVVRMGGQTFVHRIGEDGLTRSIIFDREKALAWACERYRADAAVASAVDDGACLPGGATLVAADDTGSDSDADADADDGGGGTF